MNQSNYFQDILKLFAENEIIEIDKNKESLHAKYSLINIAPDQKELFHNDYKEIRKIKVRLGDCSIGIRNNDEEVKRYLELVYRCVLETEANDNGKHRRAIEILYLLIRKSKFKKWSEESKKWFDNAYTKITKRHIYFLSFNVDSIDINDDLLYQMIGQLKISQNHFSNIKNSNPFGKVLKHYLDANNLIGNSTETTTSMQSDCAEAICFVQVVDNDMALASIHDCKDELNTYLGNSQSTFNEKIRKCKFIEVTDLDKKRHKYWYDRVRASSPNPNNVNGNLDKYIYEVKEVKTYIEKIKHKLLNNSLKEEEDTNVGSGKDLIIKTIKRQIKAKEKEVSELESKRDSTDNSTKRQRYEVEILKLTELIKRYNNEYYEIKDSIIIPKQNETMNTHLHQQFITALETEIEKQYRYIADVRKKLNREEDLEQKDKLQEKIDRYLKNIEETKELYHKNIMQSDNALTENQIIEAINQSEDRVIQKIEGLNKKLDVVKESIINKIDSENKATIQSLLNKMNSIDVQITAKIIKEVENNKIPENEIKQILSDINQAIEQIKDNELKQIYTKLTTKSDSQNSKFKMVLPLIPGILSFEHEITVNEPLKNLWKKWRQYVL